MPGQRAARAPARRRKAVANAAGDNGFLPRLSLSPPSAKLAGLSRAASLYLRHDAAFTRLACCLHAMAGALDADGARGWA